MDQNLNNIIPVASNLYKALGSLGYDNVSAVADLVDNSIDAKAKNIRIDVNAVPKCGRRIVIADDGVGMDIDELRKAITAGGMKNHDSEELGKFGMGLITASLSMGKVIRIVSKKNGILNTALCNVEENIKNNTFHADFSNASIEDRDDFIKFTNNATSGTMVCVEKCNSITYSDLKDFEKALRTKFKRVFRVFIRNGKRMYINETLLQPDDPLFINRGATILFDNDISVPSKGVLRKMHVLAVMLPNYDKKMSKSCGFNEENQGFYIMRNNREIISGLEFQSIFKKHPSFNFYRIELSFGSDLDEDMDVNVAKHSINPKDEIINEVKKVLLPYTSKMRSKKGMESFGEGNMEEGLAAKKIDKKAPATKNLDLKMQMDVGANNRPTLAAPIDNGSCEVDFFVGHLGDKSPLFNCCFQNDKVKVILNGSSDYYHLLSTSDTLLDMCKSFIENIFDTGVSKNVDPNTMASILNAAIAHKYND